MSKSIVSRLEKLEHNLGIVIESMANPARLLGLLDGADIPANTAQFDESSEIAINPALNTLPAVAQDNQPVTLVRSMVDVPRGATLEEMTENTALIPSPWNRPYPSDQPKREPTKEKAYVTALGNGIDADVWTTGLAYIDLMKSRAKRNVSRIKNIETETSVHAADKTLALELAELDVSRWESAESTFQTALDRGASVNEPPVNEPPVNEPPVNEPPVNEPPVNEPPVAQPPLDEGDRRDLPEGYVFVDGIDPAETYAAYVKATWTLEQMLEHGKIKQLDRPNLVETPSGIPTNAQEFSAFVNQCVAPNEVGAVRDMQSVMAVIMKYGQSTATIPVEQYPAVVAELTALPQTAIA